jgi:hypothetical protein
LGNVFNLGDHFEEKIPPLPPIMPEGIVKIFHTKVQNPLTADPDFVVELVKTSKLALLLKDIEVRDAGIQHKC